MMHLADQTNENGWKAWAVQVPRDRYYMAWSLRECGLRDGRHPLCTILRAFAPEGATDDNWMFDLEARTRALIQKGEQLRAGLPDGFFSAQRQRDRSLMRFAPERAALMRPATVLEGRGILIDSRGRFTLRWLQGTTPINLDFKVHKQLVPVTPTETRFIHFVAEGLEIRDEDGLPIANPGCGGNTILHARARDLEALWNAERAALGPAPVALPPPSIPPGREAFSSGHPRNRSRARVRWHLPRPRAPLAEGDAIWLLRDFCRRASDGRSHTHGQSGVAPRQFASDREIVCRTFSRIPLAAFGASVSQFLQRTSSGYRAKCEATSQQRGVILRNIGRW
ncbi:uncharacterized protein EV422DRAFT_154978 [Fimicolochytrium jonesii]|uniref:uncharacterized protein n=1 Tax=Fimicolochytrium jonesii TaxID=1396493 RepID=UPI0022FEC935|nr:uncharacterized protein EV422DRAFT_154978 [Fimicolochytrium jonesii]KAI8826130.1 hypothetical protein EV422DRAFT_154978 [Fimicolochytrium jonesii]